MFESLKVESKTELEAGAERLWNWVRSHPVLAIGALVVVTLAFAPSHPKSHNPIDAGADEPPLFI